MEIVVIKYNAGNIQSVDYALERIGVRANITDSAEEILKADRVIFPGVGEASTTMDYLRERKLDILIKELKQPVLGVCLGMQLLCKNSEENNTDCIGIFNQKVQKFANSEETDIKYKIPHMGWNAITHLKDPLFKNIGEKEYAYFVHSYYVPLSEETAAQSNYIVPFSASIQKNNFFAVQFHPEKSADVGERILSNFINISI